MSYLTDCLVCREPFFAGPVPHHVCKPCQFADGIATTEQLRAPWLKYSPRAACEIASRVVDIGGPWPRSNLGGYRKVQCPNAPCRWPRCDCGVDLVYAPKLRQLPRR